MPDNKSLPLPDPPPPPKSYGLPKVKNIPPMPPVKPPKKELEVVDKIPLKDLRLLMCDRILNDEEMKQVYVANVAMFLLDNFEDKRLDEPNWRNERAIRLLKLLFES